MPSGIRRVLLNELSVEALGVREAPGAHSLCRLTGQVLRADQRGEGEDDEDGPSHTEEVPGRVH